MEIPLSDVIRTLRRFGDLHSIETEDHAVRTRTFALRIGQKLGFDSMQLLYLGYAADVHDIGKMFIDPNIIDKAGRLNKAQRAQMEKHCELGFEAMEFIHLPEDISDAILHHQEHFDGSGYPDKQKGEQIRIITATVTVADVWDALISDRPYRRGKSPEKALEIMNKHAAWFNPKIYVAFLSVVLETEN
jgi:HD-GYP domain-containing protein (c-di-GMP phosphodiesterase class II)